MAVTVTVLRRRVPISHLLASIFPNPNPNPSGLGEDGDLSKKNTKSLLLSSRIGILDLSGDPELSDPCGRAEIEERVEVRCGRRNLLSFPVGN